MKTLLIVYHTMTGGTAQMAQAAAEGAATEPELRVRLLRAHEAGPDDVLAAAATCSPRPRTWPRWRG